MKVTIVDVTWKMETNGLNQLTQRYNGSTWDGGTERYGYSYDANGNLTQVLKETKSGTWSQAEKWVYEWNPRDQMTRAIKYTTTANNVGSVKYEYCLSCDSALSPSPPALSHRREREPLDAAAGTGIRSHAGTRNRSRSPNLNLLRADELYGNDSNGLEDNVGWRRSEVNTHRP